MPGKVGKIYCKQERKFDDQIKTVTISLNPDGKYFASVLVDDGKETPQASSSLKAVGIDLGLLIFVLPAMGASLITPAMLKNIAQF